MGSHTILIGMVLIDCHTNRIITVGWLAHRIPLARALRDDTQYSLKTTRLNMYILQSLLPFLPLGQSVEVAWPPLARDKGIVITLTGTVFFSPNPSVKRPGECAGEFPCKDILGFCVLCKLPGTPICRYALDRYSKPKGVKTVISPYVRRRRLARELIALREGIGIFRGDRIARAVSVGRQRISRLENGHVRPDLGDRVARPFDLFLIDECRWTQIMLIARDAQERGWWEKRAETIGHRQALRANLKAGLGAFGIIAGAPCWSPFRAGSRRLPLGSGSGSWGTRSRRSRVAVEVRAMRQRLLHRNHGPGLYQVIVDELVFGRAGVADDVIEMQIATMVDEGADRSDRALRVLPVGARIEGDAVPRSAFCVYQCSRPGGSGGRGGGHPHNGSDPGRSLGRGLHHLAVLSAAAGGLVEPNRQYPIPKVGDAYDAKSGSG